MKRNLVPFPTTSYIRLAWRALTKPASREPIGIADGDSPVGAAAPLVERAGRRPRSTARTSYIHIQQHGVCVGGFFRDVMIQKTQEVTVESVFTLLKLMTREVVIKELR